MNSTVTGIRKSRMYVQRPSLWWHRPVRGVRADVYREKVGSLCRALESHESRTGAWKPFELIETILLELRRPAEDHAEGDLAGMLSAARDTKRSPDTGSLLVQRKLVAGARNQHYLQLWRPAA